MPQIKNKANKFVNLARQKNDRRARQKKHVETMFNSQPRRFPFYFKPRGLNQSLWMNNAKNQVAPGFVVIKSLESGFVGVRALKACVRIIKRYIKVHKISQAKYQLLIFPDFVLTSKPKEVRMGKGKGKPAGKVAVVHRGDILLRFWSFPDLDVAYNLARSCSFKLPLKNRVLDNDW